MDMPKQTQHPFYPLELELSQIADKVGGKVSLINQVRLANRKAKDTPQCLQLIDNRREDCHCIIHNGECAATYFGMR
jgi:hypothetical protein